MPRCRQCGNEHSLASTRFSTSADTANPPPYGLMGNFNHQGALVNMECQGASLDDAQLAFEDPKNFFDVCPVCGSRNIEW